MVKSHDVRTTPYPDAEPATGPPFAYATGDEPLAGYTIKRGVGHGGFGEIYFAVSQSGKEVALKLLRRHREIELRGVRHCLNLKHSHLLALYDIREDDRGQTWVVMEFVHGPSLEQAIAQAPRGMPAAEALIWFRGVAAAVAYLHDHGIVHRDLKPANVFCDEGVVKVGDYGLSKFISASRRSGQTESIGTVHYMAPEVASGRYGKEIDVYALGVMLYESLTGRVPFEGETVAEVLMKHLTAAPDLSLLAEPYRAVVRRAMEKDPAKRYPTATAMLADLPGEAPAGVPLPAAAVPAAVRREPVGEMVAQVWRETSTAWRGARLSTPTKIVVVVLGLFALLTTAAYWIPAGAVLLAVFAGYRLVRAIVGVATQPQGRAVAAAARPAAALIVKPPKARLAELLGSLLVSAGAAAVIAGVFAVLKLYRGGGLRPEQVAWMYLVSVAGSWAILIVAKGWEGVRGQGLVRRFVLLGVGLLAGLFAGGLAHHLSAGVTGEFQLLSADPGFPVATRYELPQPFYRTDGVPGIAAFVVAFATLFAAVRWWRLVDPLRRVRLGLWASAVPPVMAGLVAWAWQFPQPWLVITAGAIAVSVQLASPWVRPVCGR